VELPLTTEVNTPTLEPKLRVVALIAQLAGQMMQHQGTQHHVELPAGKGQRLHERVPEVYLETRFPRLLAGAGNHLRRGINSVYMPFLTDLLFRHDRQSSSSTTHIQNRLASRQVRQAKRSLSKGALSAKRQQPEQEIVLRRSVKNEARSLV